MVGALKKTVFKIMCLMASSRYRWSIGIFLTLYGYARNFRHNSTLKRLIETACVTKRLEFKGEDNPINLKVSIVIPVCNGGEHLARLLAAIRRQKKVVDTEIIVIDSGSTDNTVEVARAFGCKVTEIPNAEFNHGATRQLGLDKAEGEFIVFTVQDALPTDDFWLYTMVRRLIDNPELAVASVKQFVNSDADLYSKWTNDSLYGAYGLTEDTESFLKDPGAFPLLPHNIKRRFSFVDNVCACYRGDIIRRFGFHRTLIGEDIDVGVRLVRAGAHIGFLRSTGVYHWHSNPPDYFLKRGFNGVSPLLKSLGYGIVDFGPFGINSLEDIRIRSAILYHTVRLALGQWTTAVELTPTDIHNFIKMLSATTRNFPNKYRDGGESGGNGPLKALLDNLGCRIDDAGLQKKVYRNNCLLLAAMSNLQDLTRYISDNDDTLEVGIFDFSDAVFKVTASTIGNAMGFWFAKLKKEGKADEINSALEKVLAKGVCYR